jgi:hypothetical protein
MSSAGIKRHRSLWHMILGPTIWAVHFCVTYAVTAVLCAKSGVDMGVLRVVLLAISGVAIALLGATAWLAWRQWDYTDDWDYEHAGNSTEDRREFLGHVGFLLSVISLIGVVYVTLPALFAGTCQ